MDYRNTAAALAAAGAAGWMAWAVRGRSSSVFASSDWRGNPARRSIALTFDDGPSECTPPILEVLERFGVRATFFQCGLNAERLPAIARAVAQAGHEIGNHSYSHPLFCFRSPAYMQDQLRRAQEAIGTHTGVRPVWFRAPYGVRWPGLEQAQRGTGLRGVMWTVIGYDWRLQAGAIVAYVVQRASNGAILCLHDGREVRVKPDAGETVEAVRRMVPVLLDRGYEFETVSQLLCPTS